MLPFFVEGIEYQQELSEKALKPSLTVDSIYLIKHDGVLEILHVEIETEPKSEMPHRMLEYYGILHRKHKKAIISLVVCPFRTNIADPPLLITSGGEEVLVFHYRVIRLWTYKAQKYLDQHMVSIYALLPTMDGADYEMLAQALDEMKAWYVGQPKRLATHLLWFGTFLYRTDTVSSEDKERIAEKMENLDSLLDENPFVQKRRAEGKEEGLAEGLQKALITVVEGRFPLLVELAQQRVPQVTKPDTLNLLLKGITAAPDEATARWLLDTLAA